MKKFVSAIALLVVLFLSGCLTSSSPFFEERDVIQDNRIVGIYPSKPAGNAWEITESSNYIGRYRARLIEGSGWSDYLVTLFKIGEQTYIDLVPVTDSSVARSPGGAPTSSELMRAISYEKRHVVFKVAVSDTELTLGVAMRDSLRRLSSDSPTLKKHMNWEALVIDEPTPTLRALLEKHGGGTLFDEKTVLKKQLANQSSEPTAPSGRRSP